MDKYGFENGLDEDLERFRGRREWGEESCVFRQRANRNGFRQKRQGDARKSGRFGERNRMIGGWLRRVTAGHGTRAHFGGVIIGVVSTVHRGWFAGGGVVMGGDRAVIRGAACSGGRDCGGSDGWSLQQHKSK